MERKLPVGWKGGKNGICKCKSRYLTCLKSEAEMWLASGMRGLHRARQVRIM